MLSGGEKSRVTLELPKGLFERRVDGNVSEAHEDGSLGNVLVQDGVWEKVTTSFVKIPHFLKRAGQTGETQYGFEVDAEKCAEVLGKEAERFLEKSLPAEAQSFVGSARFCLNAAQIPALQKITSRNKLDAVDELGTILAEARSRVEENILLLENGDSTYYSQHLAYMLTGLLRETAQVFTFEKGAELALGFAKSGGKAGVLKDVQEILAEIRPQVYADHIQKVGDAGRRASADGDFAAVESSLAQLQAIGNEMLKNMGNEMTPATYLLNDTQGELTQHIKQLASRSTLLSSL